MRRCVDDSFSIGSEIGAGRAAFSGADSLQAGSVRIHRENLIALVGLASGLKNKFLAVGGEVGLRIRSTVCQLPDVSKMRFPGIRLNRLCTSKKKNGRRDKGSDGKQEDNEHSRSVRRSFCHGLFSLFKSDGDLQWLTISLNNHSHHIADLFVL